MTAERDASPPRRLPNAEPEELYGQEVRLEEEAFAWYNPDKWYPVHIGQVFVTRYQVLLKLGFGSASTVWLCRDLEKHCYATLKVYETGHRQARNEEVVLRHLERLESEHPGQKLLRSIKDSFELQGKIGPHVCLVFETLGLSLADIRELAGGKLPENLLKGLVYGLLLGIDYMHSVAHVVHTDIQDGNIMLSISDTTILDDLVNEEWRLPSARKVMGDRTTYASTGLEIPDDPGDPVISDFGDAQYGEGDFEGEVMPDLYRAPEIILGIPWDEKIDIWALGLMVWDLFEGKLLYNTRHHDRNASRAAHFARTVSLLGPPPDDLLDRGSSWKEFFDEEGKLIVDGEIPESSFEEEECNLEGAEQAEFLVFLRKMLQWRPEDRLSARELMEDPWLCRQTADD
ncbi:kinase-like domain-containing protein [Colletotrichum godetiae]|uniref:non-specific serine/threonine protein kinase n=1 Tax=Colletotrichum godetiae TaxID=1209918 RepID=A0AAJ0AJE5_9PEZI|nr:kinase-like domain-containing protein [Colletotrichum godetiae]KAK1673543.1 kinase-like domain-containing protein [Colletotrichum godetiae]